MLSRPRVKPEHAPYRTAAGNVRIGSVIFGIGAEIEDPHGWVWDLTQAMDGTRTPLDVAELVAAAHDVVTPADVLRAVEDLSRAGHLEDAAAPGSALPEEEQERYGRGVPLLRWMDRNATPSAWRLQERLRSARVLLIGIGGTGGYAAQALVASGVGHLHCVDPDDVELSNLNRQPLYREKDIGRPKTEAAHEDLMALNSAVEVTVERRSVDGPGDLKTLLGRGGAPYDLLLLCADRPARIRRWANRVCLEAGVPWVDGGYHGPLVSVGLHVPGKGGCWECVRLGEVERRDLGLPEGADETAASPVMPWNPVNAVTAGLSGLLMAHVALCLLTGVASVEPGARYGINLAALDDVAVERYPRRDDCPACGRAAERRAPGG
ncbi:HesA/MoeB/ThiF family protein [Streptomyces arboris]|uniref:HesA/MoeB/ThiF family protein n=1 Tax=Streptomyces arboris TaxID=2600619 RepID=UPI003C2C3AEA